MSVAIPLLGGCSGLGLWILSAGLRGHPLLRRQVDGARPVHRHKTRTITFPAVAAAAILLATGWPVAALLAAAAVGSAPRLLGGKAARTAAIDRTEAIATWTEMVRDAMAAASGLEEAIVATGSIAPGAIRREVRHLVSRLERQPLTNALANFADDLAHPSGDLVVTALAIASRSEASDLTGLLSRLAEATRGEARMRVRVEVGRTQVRTASKVVIGAVGATVALLALLNRDYLSVYADPAGQFTLLAIGAIFALGGWLLVRMSELEMPERFSARRTEPGAP